MQIIVYSFIKSCKSTKIPQNLSEDKYTDMECVLKDNGCGIIQPVIEINYGLERAPVNYNYAYIPEFKRYYFVRDWVFNDGLWYGILVEDFLATWISDILATEAYILRCSKTYNPYVSDTLYPITGDIQIISSEENYPYKLGNNGIASGEFVMGVQAWENGHTFGSTTYYVLTVFQMSYFMSIMLGTMDWLNFDWDTADTFITQDILKTLFNPIQYITSCVWIPGGVAADRKVQESNVIKFGWWEIEIINVHILDQFIPDTFILEIDVPKHPQAPTRGEYLNLSPFSTYQLHVPPYGLIDIPADELMGENKLKVEWVFDYMTGQGRIMVATSKRFINIVNIMFGVPVSIGQIAGNPWSALESGIGFVNTVAGRATSALSNFVGGGLSALGSLGGNGGNMGGIASGISGTAGIFTLPFQIIGDAVSAIGDIANALSPTVQTMGGAPSGTLIGFAIESFVRLSGKFALIADEDNVRLGRPYCKKGKLINFTGYVKTLGANVQIEGNGDEQAAVNAALDGGIFIE